MAPLQKNGNGYRYPGRTSRSRLIEGPLVIAQSMRPKIQPSIILLGVGIGYVAGVLGLSFLQVLAAVTVLLLLWLISIGLSCLWR